MTGSRPSEEDLEALRVALNDLDRRLVEVLAERQRVVARVAELKSTAELLPVRDRAREEALLTRATELGEGHGLDRAFVARLYQEILDHSLRRQHEHLVGRDNPQRDGARPLVVLHLGGRGTNSHRAASAHFGARDTEVLYRSAPSFEDMIDAVMAGDADYAVVPIENTTAGSIHEVYDLLYEKDVHLVGEEVQRIHHCLLAVEKVGLDRIRRVFSHPQALAQCSRLLRSLRGCRVESVEDTAAAARRVREDDDLSQAAIASPEAAAQYGLAVLAEDIADRAENFTRFVVVAREPIRVDLRIPCKTSLLYSTPHEKGALVATLNILADHGLNLTKLESRPSESPWSYRFYVDLEGNASSTEVMRALEALAVRTRGLKVLGSYPARAISGPDAAEPSGRGTESRP